MPGWFLALDPALKVVLGILSLISAIVTACAYVIRQRRAEMRKIVNEHGDDIGGRLDHVTRSNEIRFDAMERRVCKIEAQVGDGFDELDGRMHAAEKTLETVARQSAVASLDATVREMRGEMRAEMRIVTGQLDTLYKAALAAAQNRKPET